MFHSIRWRLITSYMFITLLAVSVVGFTTYRLVWSYLSQMEYDSLHATAEAVAHQAYPLMWPRVKAYELQQLSQTAAFLGDVRVSVLDPDQRIVAVFSQSGDAEHLVLAVPFAGIRSAPGDADELFPGAVWLKIGEDEFVQLPPPFVDMLPPGTSVTVIRRGEGLWGGQFIFEEVVPGQEGDLKWQAEAAQTTRSQAAVTVPIGNTVDPVGYVQVSNPPALSTTLLGQLRQALAVAGIGAVMIAGLFGLWNSQRLASPLKSLARASAQMGAGDLSVRANPKFRGEIGELSQQFNQMADNLQISFDQLAAERDALRRFIADASHELRTPITALKNFNTLLLGSAADDPAARAEFLSESQVQIERLEWMTHNLLDLSRLDAGLLDLDLADHDLREIIEAAVTPFKSLAADKKVALSAALPDVPVILHCDRARLEMSLTNLLDNALKFTPEGGEVTVTLERDSDQIWVAVADTGAGIPPEDLAHIFERFYRGRSHAVEGSGLGLAIVKSVVEAHDGTVSVEAALDEGTVFKLVFPSDSSVV